MSHRESRPDVVQTVVNNFGALFRHLFPGVLVLGVARIIRPGWFGWIDTHSWPNLAFTGIVALTVGNACFAVNRYILFQSLDCVVYLWQHTGKAGYHKALAAHVADSLYLSNVAALADQHIKFRYASVLFLYTVAEASAALAYYGYYRCELSTFCALLIVGGVWQHAITRLVDDRVVAEGKLRDSNQKP